MTDGPVTQRCSSMKNRLPTGGPEYREREKGESEHKITASNIFWESSTIDDQASYCFCLVSYVYSL